MKRRAGSRVVFKHYKSKKGKLYTRKFKVKAERKVKKKKKGTFDE